jgi:ferredoxin-nitrite reductase
LLAVNLESDNETLAAYHIYIGDGLGSVATGDSQEKFGRQLYQYVTVAEVPILLAQMLQVYQVKRQNPHESFGEFVNRYEITQLQSLFSLVK